MAMRAKPETGEVGVKQRYRVTNWSEYDRAPVNRGNLTIWFDEASIRGGWTPPHPIGRGKPGWYSGPAIQTCLTIKTSFQLPYRAAEGLIKSLMHLCRLERPVPDHAHPAGHRNTPPGCTKQSWRLSGARGFDRAAQGSAAAPPVADDTTEESSDETCHTEIRRPRWHAGRGQP